MATLASQVILHPLVSQGLRFGSTTLGRDKTYRALQYLARFLAWYLVTKGQNLEAARWAALKVHLATARKLMRLGKPLEHLQAALRASLTSAPSLEQITTISRQVGYFGYLAYDSIVWASAIKFLNLNPDTTKRVAKISNRFWLAGILFSITHSVLKIVRLNAEVHKLQASKKWSEKDLGEETQREAKLSAVQTSKAVTRQQLIVDVLDIWIPATGADVVTVNEGTLGVFGFITSVIGMSTQWKASQTKP
ncbi:peroxisomal biogenesis factor 11 [Collybia nuda]|uniref:Peroxisomal biogenesis factor 11 n=1 Tax=Collybia nuda TaxID=64659 RepID=A0A9P5XTN6_9AGAR|nr:peroxisomal biogenesis factor 11 [Collybia nuda]